MTASKQFPPEQAAENCLRDAQSSSKYLNRMSDGTGTSGVPPITMGVPAITTGVPPLVLVVVEIPVCILNLYNIRRLQVSMIGIISAGEGF